MSHRPDDPFSGRLYRSSDYPEDRSMTDPTTDVPVERPNPLRKAAAVAAAMWGAGGAVLGLAVQFGIIDAAQSAALSGLGEALPAALIALGNIASVVIPLGAAIGAAFHTQKTGKQDVTPVVDPRDRDGHKLVRVDGGALGGRAVGGVVNVHERGER